MKHWISCVARAYEREPGLFLLAAGVVLAVVFWHLPVPAFLFADPASGSAEQCSCKMTNKNCESWAKDGPKGCPAAGSGWEDCDHGLTTPQPCAGGTKRLPQVAYVYENCTRTQDNKCIGACQNTKSCQHASESTNHCLMKYVRPEEGKVGVHTWGSGGVRSIHFKPAVRYSFQGFTHVNVCNPTIEGWIDFSMCVFADMMVCKETKTDDDNYHGTSGWAFKSAKFQKGGSGLWQDPEGGEIAFNIYTTKSCEECGDGDDDPVQHLRTACHVFNTGGVKLGQACLIAMVLFAVTDPTECYQGGVKEGA